MVISAIVIILLLSALAVTLMWAVSVLISGGEQCVDMLETVVHAQDEFVARVQARAEVDTHTCDCFQRGVLCMCEPQGYGPLPIEWRDVPEDELIVLE